MANIVWNGSYSDCTVLTVTLSVGIGHRLFNRTLISHLNKYVTVPLTAQHSTAYIAQVHRMIRSPCTMPVKAHFWFRIQRWPELKPLQSVSCTTFFLKAYGSEIHKKKLNNLLGAESSLLSYSMLMNIIFNIILSCVYRSQKRQNSTRMKYFINFSTENFVCVSRIFHAVYMTRLFESPSFDHLNNIW